MSSRHDTIGSQLEWNSQLSTTNLPQADGKSKYLRKVSWSLLWLFSLALTEPFRRPLSLLSVCNPPFLWFDYMLTSSSAGPNTNNVEKLAELRQSGVNIGTRLLDRRRILSSRAS